MSILESLRPTTKPRVIDLVAEAGVDVSEWARGRGGTAGAASNPRFAFEWSFVERGQVVVLNIWHTTLREQDGQIVCHFDIERRIERLHANGSQSSRSVVARAQRVLDALLYSMKAGVPLRVILLAGDRRGYELGEDESSSVRYRSLDSAVWSATGYDAHERDWILTREASPRAWSDQFDVEQEQSGPARSISRITSVRERDPLMRIRVLARAKGRCEWCGEEGFFTSDRGRYLEVHHIVPLASDGPDHPANMIALCPNHHREAHHGREREAMALEMAQRARSM